MAIGIYLGALTASLLVTNFLAREYDVHHPDQAVEVLFLTLAAAGMSIPEARIERVRLTSILYRYVIVCLLIDYYLAATVCVWTLVLTDTIAGRHVLRVPEWEQSYADRHLFHSRAVEGVVDNLRSHFATALAYLKEID